MSSREYSWSWGLESKSRLPNQESVLLVSAVATFTDCTVYCNRPSLEREHELHSGNIACGGHKERQVSFRLHNKQDNYSWVTLGLFTQSLLSYNFYSHNQFIRVRHC